MGSTHSLTKTLERVSTEIRLHVLAYNPKRLMSKAALDCQFALEGIRTSKYSLHTNIIPDRLSLVVFPPCITRVY